MSRENEILSMTIPQFPEKLCNDVIAGLFFANETEAEKHKKAKEICDMCIHKIECRQWADDHEEMHGTWGGETEKERRKRWRKEGRLKKHSGGTRVNLLVAPRVAELRKQGLSNSIIAMRLGLKEKGVDRALAHAKRMGIAS